MTRNGRPESPEVLRGQWVQDPHNPNIRRYVEDARDWERDQPEPRPEVPEFVACEVCGATSRQRCRAPSGVAVAHVGRVGDVVCACGEPLGGHTTWCYMCALYRQHVNKTKQRARAKAKRRERAA